MGRARDAISKMIMNSSPSTTVNGTVLERDGDYYTVFYTDRMGEEIVAENVRCLYKKGLKPPGFVPGDPVLIGFVNGNSSMPYIMDAYCEQLDEKEKEAARDPSVNIASIWGNLACFLKR